MIALWRGVGALCVGLESSVASRFWASRNCEEKTRSEDHAHESLK
jgi:hypothetical protein